MPQLNVTLVPAPDQVVVRITGDSDLSTAPLVADALRQAAGLGTRQVVVDVSGLRIWDCSALHALAAFTADLAPAGRSCRIVGAPPRTRRLIAIAEFTDALQLDGPLSAPAPLERPPEQVPPAWPEGSARGASGTPRLTLRSRRAPALAMRRRA